MVEQDENGREVEEAQEVLVVTLIPDHPSR
jgi:hypothetical protein